MPRVKPLTRPCEEEIRIRQEIGMVMGALQINIKQLSEMTGIGYSTMKHRLSKDGIPTMRMDEYWAIKKLGKKQGIL